jgi:hypothetical protein
LREAVSGGMAGLRLFDTRLMPRNKDQKPVRLITFNSIPAKEAPTAILPETVKMQKTTKSCRRKKKIFEDAPYKR